MANVPARPALLPAPPREHLGPAMSKLSPKRQEFVRQYVGLGQRNAKQAYIRAGYNASTENSAAVNGCVLLHNADVQAAVKEYCLSTLVALAPTALRVAGDLLESPQTDAAVRAGIAKTIMDRTGLIAQTEHKVTVEHIGSDPRALEEARQLVQSLGLTEEQVQSLLGRTVAAKVIDAAYVDITDPAEPEEAPEDEELLL